MNVNFEPIGCNCQCRWMGFPKLQDAFVKNDTRISCCMEVSKLLDEFVKVFICISCPIFYLFLAKNIKLKF